MEQTEPAQCLPPAFCEIPAGPELAAALAGIDPTGLDHADTVDYLQAEYRQLCHQQARVFTAMVEVARRGWDTDRHPVRQREPVRFAADEIRAALAVSRRQAEHELELAWLVGELPGVHAALAAGAIDRVKAVVFADHLAWLAPEHRRQVLERLLPQAARWTPGYLAARIKRLAHALDPDGYAARYTRAVTERKVVGYQAEDGSMTITGTGLPVDEGEAACGHLDDLARAIKAAGHPGHVDSIRADLFTGLLSGRFHQLTRRQIITAMTGQDRGQADDQPDIDMGTGTRTGIGPASAVPPARSGCELRVALSTLLGWDSRPGEIPGRGLITLPDTARAIAAQQRAAEWRYAIVDDAGRLLWDGVTRYRPEWEWDRWQRGGGIVEVHLPEALLEQLTRDPPPEWKRVIDNIARQYEIKHRPVQDPHARLPGAALRRHVEMRDRFCIWPGCQAPAASSQQDHTRDYANGGRTAGHNLGPACGHDHMLKTEGGWKVEQPEPGTFVWTSPLGKQYRTEPRPITDPFDDEFFPICEPARDEPPEPEPPPTSDDEPPPF